MGLVWEREGETKKEKWVVPQPQVEVDEWGRPINNGECR